MIQEKEPDRQNIYEIIDLVQKSLFKHTKTLNPSSKIVFEILDKDDKYINYNLKYIEGEKEIEKKYKKNYKSKRGLNSINNLWHNKNKIGIDNPSNDKHLLLKEKTTKINTTKNGGHNLISDNTEIINSMKKNTEQKKSACR